MGPSRSGKSTLLPCLAGILVPASGEILFDGRRVDTMSETGRSTLRRGRLGVVFQFGQPVPPLAAPEDVGAPPPLRGAPRGGGPAQAAGPVRRGRPRPGG